MQKAWTDSRPPQHLPPSTFHTELRHLGARGDARGGRGAPAAPGGRESGPGEPVQAAPFPPPRDQPQSDTQHWHLAGEGGCGTTRGPGAGRLQMEGAIGREWGQAASRAPSP